MSTRITSEPQSGVRLQPALLLGGTATVLVLLALFALLQYGASEEALRSSVRSTARIAVMLFSLTFATSSLHTIGRSHATKWLLANRRYLGLSFALAHAGHGLCLVALGSCFPAPFLDELDPTSLIGGGLAYAFLFAMAATSSGAAFRKLGRRRWLRLHTAGSYYLWLSFAISYFPLAMESPEAMPFAAVLTLALLLRVARFVRVSRQSG